MASQSSYGRTPTIAETNEFLKKVKDSFQPNDEKTAEFKRLCNIHAKLGYTTRLIGNNVLSLCSSDYLSVQLSAMRLFKDHPELLADFNALLPKGYDIAREHHKATELIKKIQERFSNDKRFTSFLVLLNGWQDKKKSTPEICEEIPVLFAGHQDLIEDFMQLPSYSSDNPKKRKTSL